MSRKIRVRRWGNVDCRVRCPAPGSVCLCLSVWLATSPELPGLAGGLGVTGAQVPTGPRSLVQYGGESWGNCWGPPPGLSFPHFPRLLGWRGSPEGSFPGLTFGIPGVRVGDFYPLRPGPSLSSPGSLGGRWPPGAAALSPSPLRSPHPGSPREGRTEGRRGAAWRKQVETRARPLQVTWLRLLARWNSGCLWPAESSPSGSWGDP